MNATTWVEVNGAVLAAEFQKGIKDELPLVFLHAGVADGRMWQAQWDHFATSHTLLRYDRRGFGLSRHLHAAPHSRVADLWAVMDAAGLDRAMLIGCSQGGRVALDAALARPDRVAALVLVAPAVSGAPKPELDANVRALSVAIDAACEAGDVDRANELEAALWLEGPTSQRGRVGSEARALFLAMNDIALRAADAGSVIEELPAWERLEQIHVPTMVLWGDLDLLHLQARCKELARRIPAAVSVLLQDTAHLPGLEAPERFNVALEDFLRNL